MSNCKHLKLKLDRTLECKLTGKKITWNECKNCKLREYKLMGLNSVRTSQTQSDAVRFKSIQIHSKKPKLDISSKTRKIVNNRDNHICRLCGKPSVHLHHIVYRSNDSKLIDEPDNLISLCFECHQLVHSNKKKYQPILQNIIQDTKKESRH